MECDCKFKIVKTSNWLTVDENDAAFGLECKKCKKLICTGYTKKELKEMNKNN